MSKRYIDAEPYEGMCIMKPITVVIEGAPNTKCGSFLVEQFAKIKYIDDIPTVDVQEVKHGKWAYCRNNDYESGIHIAMCTNCSITQSVVFWQKKPTFKYCPYCGAKMDGDKND